MLVMATIVTTVFSVGTKLNLKYPKNGTRNILVSRSGVVENSGIGPAGPFVQMKLTNGQYRTFSNKRMVDATIA
jgi:hypothetical protein